MRALDVMVDCLAQVVQQAGALGSHNVQAKLGSHHATQIRDLEGVLKHVLTKRGTVAQGTKGLDDLGVQIVDAGIEGSLLASLARAAEPGRRPCDTSPRYGQGECGRRR